MHLHMDKIALDKLLKNITMAEQEFSPYSRAPATEIPKNEPTGREERCVTGREEKCATGGQNVPRARSPYPPPSQASPQQPLDTLKLQLAQRSVIRLIRHCIIILHVYM